MEELLKVSNPNQVYNNAIKYLGKNVKIAISNRLYKKYTVYDPINKIWVHFGDIRYEDFTHHKNNKRRESYLKRATNIKGNWKENKYSRNNLAINLLW